MRLGNIQEGKDGNEMMEVNGKTHGTMLLRSSEFGGFPKRQPANAFLLPDEMECWPVALPLRGNATVFVHHEMELASVNDAWQFLIARCASLASTHVIKPHDIILGNQFFFPSVPDILVSNLSPFLFEPVTRSLRIDDHQVDDWRPPALPLVPAGSRATGFGAPAFPQRGGFGAAPVFPHHASGFGAQALSVPSIVYLITSSRPDFAAYITDDPMGRPRPRPTGSTSWCFSCRSGL